MDRHAHGDPFRAAAPRIAMRGSTTMGHRSDPELIQRCLAGEQRAWDELVERYGRLVYSVPRRYGLSDADAGDVVQNVFLTAYRKLGGLKDQERLSAWLITTAHRESWRVGKRSDAAGALNEQFADVGSPSDDELVRWEQQHLVRLALEELGGSCRELLMALFLDRAKPSYETIADQLGIKVGSIGPTRARCFQKLEAILLRMGFQASVLEQPSAPQDP